MLIILGSDHAGLALKEQIKSYLENSHNIIDCGALVLDKDDDFSKYVLLMRKTFDQNPEARIVAVCGSGVGMSIGLNKHKNIKCVLGHSVEEVVKARQHNNVNALSLSGSTNIDLAKSMIDAFLSTKSAKGKYQRRMSEIELN